MVSYSSVCNAKNELLTIDSIRQHILDGNAYRAWDTSFNIAKDTSMNFAFIPDGEKTSKFKFFVEADQSTNLRIIEDASWNSVLSVNRLTCINFNRSSTKTMNCALYKAPSMDGKWGSGTLISSKYAFAISTTGPQGRTAFGSSADEYSMILSPSKLYVFNIVNTGPLSGNIAVRMRIVQDTV